jgi:hypothetical protein
MQRQQIIYTKQRESQIARGGNAVQNQRRVLRMSGKEAKGTGNFSFSWVTD